VKYERAPRMPAKSMLSWRISRLRLDEEGAYWLATGYKANRVAVIELPDLASPECEEEWIAEIEARFEQQAFDPCEGERVCPALGSGLGSGSGLLTSPRTKESA
jgi:hypothetical protein